MDKNREEYLQFIETAYRLIRIKSRDTINPCSNAELGEYVRGVVDMQTEMWSNNQYAIIDTENNSSQNHIKEPQFD